MSKKKYLLQIMDAAGNVLASKELIGNFAEDEVEDELGEMMDDEGVDAVQSRVFINGKLPKGNES